MRNPASPARSFTVRSVRAVAVLGTVLLGLLSGAAPALAATGAVQVNAAGGVPFGLLGPVGMVAVAVGVLGMAIGVARSRKKATAGPELVPTEPVASDPAVVEEPNRASLTPAGRTPAA